MRKYMIVLLIFNVLLGWAQSEWPMYRGNSALTGVSKAKLGADFSMQWQFETEDAVKASPLVAEGRILVGSTDMNMYCLDLNGKEMWRFKTDNAIESPALILNGTVYFGNLDGALYALDLKTGRKKWMYMTDGQIMGAPNWGMSGKDTVILIGSYDFFLHCVSAKSGTKKWAYESDNYLNGAPSVENGYAYFGGCDGFLHKVNIQNGQASKKVEIATYVAASPVVENDMAFVGDYDGRFSAVDVLNDSVAWVYEHEDVHLPFIASAALSEKYILAASRDKHIYCFNKQNGKLQWRKNSGLRIDASPIIIENGVLIVNMRGDIQFYDIKSGEMEWSYELGVAVQGNPAVIDGKIILGADDGSVYCLSNKK